MKSEFITVTHKPTQQVFTRFRDVYTLARWLKHATASGTVKRVLNRPAVDLRDIEIPHAEYANALELLYYNQV